MDPTLTMLRRVLAGASQRLVIERRPARDGPTVAAIASDTPHADRFIVDWTALRGFADWARRHPAEVAQAVEDPPRRTGTPLDAILASFVEELCDDLAIDHPRWTSDVGAESPPWAPPGTPNMLRLAERNTPDAFRRRGLTVARSDLFRDRANA